MRHLTFGYLLQGAGITLIAFSLLVDFVLPGAPGFGSVQYSGIVVGVALILAGAREVMLPRSALPVRVLFALYFLGVVVVGLIPQSYKVDEARHLLGTDELSGADLFINVCGFLPFGYLLMSCVMARDAGSTGNVDRRSAGVVLAAGLVASLGIELSQYWIVPGRFASLIDWLANGIGTLLGVVLYELARRWDARVRVPNRDDAAQQ